MTRWYLDTEFVDDGRTLDFISIGLVREDGEKGYYAVNGDDRIIERAVCHDWLRGNVVKHLPVRVHRAYEDDPSAGMSQRRRITGWDWDDGNPEVVAVKPKKMIAAQVARMLTIDSDGPPQLWAWYSAYDHVIFAQLFGAMTDYPPGFPMLTCDLKQEAQRLGDPQVPAHTGRVHHAFDDAVHDRGIHQFLTEYEAEAPR